MRWWRRFLCRWDDHVIPAGFDLDRRWATCARCGEMFDAAELARVHDELSVW